MKVLKRTFAYLVLGIGLLTCSSEKSEHSPVFYQAPIGFPEISRHRHCQTDVFETSDKFMEIYPIKAINDENLRTAIRGQYYEQDIKAEVRNEPDDDEYDYLFEFSSALSSEMSFTADNRTLTISGYPDKIGTFEMYIKVYSTDLQEEHSGTDIERCQYHIDVTKFYVTVIDESN